jgi:hypothetical protein
MYHNCTDCTHVSNPQPPRLRCFTGGQVDRNAFTFDRHADQTEWPAQECTVMYGVMVMALERDVWECLHVLMWPWKRSDLFSCTGYSSWAAHHLKTKASQSFEALGTNCPMIWHHISERLNPSMDNFQYNKISTASTQQIISAFHFTITDLLQYHLLPPD